MPATDNEINQLNELIGPPPRGLAWLAIFSFIALFVVFYILFFAVHFQYAYEGMIQVNHDSPDKLILSLPNRSETDINRINTGKLSLVIEHTPKPIEYFFDIGKPKKYLGGNQFLFDNEIKLIPNYSFPCVVYSTGATLYQRFIFKFYK